MDAEGEAVLESRMISPQKLARGDLVTYISPLDPSMIVCKRVLGLPGDIVCVDPTGKITPSTEHVVIPEGHLWMSGDNAEMSRDSRYYGPVSMALVRGKLVAKVMSRWLRSSPSPLTLFVRSGLRLKLASSRITFDIWTNKAYHINITLN